VNRKTTDRYFNYFRSLIQKEAIKERTFVKLNDGIEADGTHINGE